MTLSQFTRVKNAAIAALGIASEHTPRLEHMLIDLQQRDSTMPTITAIALATFQLFVATDIKRVIPVEDIIEGASHILAPLESEIS